MHRGFFLDVSIARNRCKFQLLTTTKREQIAYSWEETVTMHRNNLIGLEQLNWLDACCLLYRADTECWRSSGRYESCYVRSASCGCETRRTKGPKHQLLFRRH